MGEANRAADKTFVAIVNGGKGAVKINGGGVSLNLASIVDAIAAQLGLPSNLGSKLPASAANLKVFDSKQLKYVQNGGKALKGLALWLTILCPILYLLAIYLARGHRRRTLMTVGFAIFFAGVIGWAVRSILESAVPNSLVKEASLRPVVKEVVVISTGLLGEVISAFILVGLVAAAAAWFAGPARPFVAARRAIAPFLREEPGGTFAITTAVMVLIFIWDPIPATGTPAGIIAFLALALFGPRYCAGRPRPSSRTRGGATRRRRCTHDGEPSATGAAARRHLPRRTAPSRSPTSSSGSQRCATTARSRPRSTTPPRQTSSTCE